MRDRALPLIALTILFAGCSPAPMVGGQRRTSEAKRIVSLSPGITDCLIKLGIGPKIVGRTASCDWEQYGIASAFVVVRGTTPDYDGLVRLKPDLVIYDETLYSKLEIDQFSKLGLPTLGLKAHSLDELEGFLMEIGKAAAIEPQASDVVDKLHAARAQAQAQSGSRKPKTAIIVDGGNGSYLIAGRQSFIAEASREAGADIVGPDSDRFMALSAEQLIAFGPEAIFTGNIGKRVLTDPQLKTVPAVAKRRVYDISEKTVSRIGTRVESMLEPMSRVLTQIAGANQ